MFTADVVELVCTAIFFFKLKVENNVILFISIFLEKGKYFRRKVSLTQKHFNLFNGDHILASIVTINLNMLKIFQN